MKLRISIRKLLSDCSDAFNSKSIPNLKSDYYNQFGRAIVRPIVVKQEDTICDALAIHETILDNDVIFESLRARNLGAWALREHVAGGILPVVRRYYSVWGEDLDFDFGFVPPFIAALHEHNWDLNFDYNDICKTIVAEWWAE